MRMGLGTSEFMNLVGWNRYWKRSRFSYLDRHVLRWKSCKLTSAKLLIYFSTNIYLWRVKKRDAKKDKKGDEKNAIDLGRVYTAFDLYSLTTSVNILPYVSFFHKIETVDRQARQISSPQWVNGPQIKIVRGASRQWTALLKFEIAVAKHVLSHVSGR